MPAQAAFDGLKSGVPAFAWNDAAKRRNGIAVTNFMNVLEYKTYSKLKLYK